MALQHLTDEQIRTWSRAQKDRWWLENVYRGDMAQLTLRSALTGFILGGLLSATNLYVGAKTGITLGVGLTSVIIAFGVFKLLSAAGARDMTILENNCMQSIATAAGYMTMPLLSSLVAYMWMTNTIIPWHQILLWNILLSFMGVLVAFPMKRRFINDEQQPFPEGRACGVVLDTLYSSGSAAAGMLQARALTIAAVVAGTIQFLSGHGYQTYLQVKLLGLKTALAIPEKLDQWYYDLAAKYGWSTPKIGGIDIRELALRPALDLAMVGAGGLMGVKITTSLMLGMIVNFAILAPWVINLGDLAPAKIDADGVPHYGRQQIVNHWAIWWGVTIMVVGSLVALFAKPKMIFGAFAGMFSRKPAGDDPLKHIELPLWVSFVGIPILGLAAAWMAQEFFGVKWWLALASLPLVFALSLICTNAMALTSWTPTGALSKITQFTFGAIDRTNPATNLMTAGITSEVASNSANLLSDIKPGYMLGAKPRQQAIGHAIGIVAGALASTPLFFVMFMHDLGDYGSAPNALMNAMVPEDSKFTFPGALQWKGVADIIAKGFNFAEMQASIRWSILGAAIAALLFETLRILTRGRFPLSPVSIGLGVVLPPDATLAMWFGALAFWALGSFNRTPGTTGHKLWVESQESICAGIIAGAAILGIGDKLVEAFLLK